MLALIGCSQGIQPKAWLSVEKAPMRVIIVDNEKDIEPETVHRIISQLKGIEYESYQFNSGTNIGVATSVNDQRHSSSSNILDVGGK
jgi:hypothetical protein